LLYALCLLDSFVLLYAFCRIVLGVSIPSSACCQLMAGLARIFHELSAATVYLTVLPGVLGCSFGYAQDKLTLRRTAHVRLGSNSLRLPGITAISTVPRQQFMKHPG
jgi:hypothetical protein